MTASRAIYAVLREHLSAGSLAPRNVKDFDARLRAAARTSDRLPCPRCYSRNQRSVPGNTVERLGVFGGVGTYWCYYCDAEFEVAETGDRYAQVEIA